MALIRKGYQLDYEDLSPDSAMGSVAVVPWDSTIFGFPVASFRPGPGDFAPDQVDIFRSRFAAWMQAKNISLCSSTLTPTQSFWRQVLPQVGFEFVDLSLQAALSLFSAKLPPARFQLRLALPEDHAAIEAIAAESFSHGRYHADPHFPKHLANRRYSQWVRNTLSNPSEIDRMYVLEEGGRVAGFYHVTIEHDVSDLRLAAVAPELKGTGLGVELYAGTLHELRRQNVRRVVTSISALNYNVVNLFSMLGFRFSSPEIIYHRHAFRQVQS
ncbi:MAG: GNAT family N-acetyltransferase [Terriglobia bacterium]